MDSLTNTSQIKKINTELIKAALKSQPRATKLSVAQATGLSLATCGTILNELAASGEVIEAEAEKTNGGRPAARYVFNADFSSVLCFYAKLNTGGKESLHYTVANLVGETIDEGELRPDKINYETVENFVAGIIKKYKNIRAVGIGIPGVVKKGIVSVCDISGLSGVMLAKRLKEKFGLEILIENDMNLTVYGFYQQQADGADKTIAFVFFPEDFYPGAGIITNGRVLKGCSNFAGEISYLPFGLTPVALNREELLESLGNASTLIPIAAHTVASIVSVINPETIILASDILGPEHIKTLLPLCYRYIPMEHMPEIEIRSSDIHREYMGGILKMALDSLSYPPRYI